MTNDKNLYKRFILRKDLKIYRLIEMIEIDEGFHPYILSLLVFIAVDNMCLLNNQIAKISTNVSNIWKEIVDFLNNI